MSVQTQIYQTFYESSIEELALSFRTDGHQSNRVLCKAVVYAILVNYIPVIATSLQLTKSSKLLMVS